MQTYAQVTEPRYFYLKHFQSERLRDTYADFAEKPQYHEACDFFFNRLYSTEDSSDRDAAFKGIYDKASRFMGGDIIRSMEKLIELQDLTLVLDRKLLSILEVLEAPVEFDMADYEKAYAWSDNYPDRVRQIDLLVFTNHLVHNISHRFGIGMVLRGLRTACRFSGDTRMVDFLSAGYRAFANLKRIEPLAEAIQVRETERLDRIFGQHSGPPANLEKQLEALAKEENESDTGQA